MMCEVRGFVLFRAVLKNAGVLLRSAADLQSGCFRAAYCRCLVAPQQAFFRLLCYDDGAAIPFHQWSNNIHVVLCRVLLCQGVPSAALAADLLVFVCCSVSASLAESGIESGGSYKR